MALRNHLLLDNRTAAPAFGDGSPFLPRKPSGTRAQRLALRRSVLLRANLDSSSASATDLLTETARPQRAARAGAKRENRLQAAEIPPKLAANEELVSAPLSGRVQMNSEKSQRAIPFRPEVMEVIAALLRGEDIEKTLAPWTEIFTLEEWNKVVAQTGDVDWELVLNIFNSLKEKNVFAVQAVPLGDKGHNWRSACQEWEGSRS